MKGEPSGAKFLPGGGGLPAIPDSETFQDQYIGGKMKKIILVTLALGAALAYIPSALADSFGYKTSGSNAIGNPTLGAGPADFASGVADAGVYAPNFPSGNPAVNNRTPFTFGPAERLKVNNGSGPESLAMSGNGGFLFDSLLYPGNAGTGTLERGVLVDVSGYQLNLFSGGFGSGNNSNAASNGRSSEKSIGYRINNEASKGIGDKVGTTATLTETPEPGSLFLLGTGLLCLALALFRKAAKPPAES